MADNFLPLVAVIVVAGLAALAGLVVFSVRALRRRDPQSADPQLLELARLQAETAVRIEAMRDMLAGRQAELHRAVNERLDSVTHHLNQSMTTTRQHTVESLQRLNERLAVIDNAQRNITDLASQVTSLQSVLANKQQRGAFGQGRMEFIVQDGLPKDCYEFQFTLSNKCRPDCAVFLPDQRPLTIDAKFPLEAVTALREAKTEEERKQAASRLRQDLARHIGDIADKYLIPGETQDLALMFVPSESIFAELHDGFDDIVQKAFRSKVVIVSPSLLMLAIQVIQQIQKDARMREAADQIHVETPAAFRPSQRGRAANSHFGGKDRKAGSAHPGGRVRWRGRPRSRSSRHPRPAAAPAAGRRIRQPATRRRARIDGASSSHRLPPPIRPQQREYWIARLRRR